MPAPDQTTMRRALERIAGASIPDQPASSDGDEAVWIMRHVSNLRRIAAEALQASPTSKPGNPDTTAATLRYARLYSDGSFNVASDGEDQATAIARISGSTDDDDTQLVQVEIRVVVSLGYPKLKVVDADPNAAEIERLRAALKRIIAEGPPAQYERIAREAINHGE